MGVQTQAPQPPRAAPPHLEKHVLALERLGGRLGGGHEPELDTEAREQPQHHLLLAVPDAEGWRADVAGAVEDVRRQQLLRIDRRRHRRQRQLGDGKRHSGLAGEVGVGADPHLVDALREEVHVLEAAQLHGALCHGRDLGARPRSREEHLSGQPRQRTDLHICDDRGLWVVRGLVFRKASSISRQIVPSGPRRGASGRG